MKEDEMLKIRKEKKVLEQRQKNWQASQVRQSDFDALKTKLRQADQ